MTDTNSLKPILEQIEKEKGISSEELFTMIENALTSVFRKHGESEGLEYIAHMDRNTAQIRVFLEKKVVKSVKDSSKEIDKISAMKIDPSAQIGEMIKVENPAELAQIISDRHRGIGSDGLILICPSQTADVRMRIFNADGSEAEMCGNGIRCVAKYTYEHKLAEAGGEVLVPGQPPCPGAGYRNTHRHVHARRWSRPMQSVHLHRPSRRLP